MATPILFEDIFQLKEKNVDGEKFLRWGPSHPPRASLVGLRQLCPPCVWSASPIPMASVSRSSARVIYRIGEG